MNIEDSQGDNVAKVVEEYIQSLKPSLNPKVIFHPNYVRKGTIFEIGEAGILLNQDAIQALVETTIDLIKNLCIRQAKAYMYVDEVNVDFNNSNQMMRIKRSPNQISHTPEEEYAIYFEAKEE